MRRSCSGCPYKDICHLTRYSRMYRKICYIDELSRTLNRSPKFILDNMYMLEFFSGVEVNEYIKCVGYDLENWKTFSKKEKANRVEYIITYRPYRPPTPIEKSRCANIIVALADIAFGLQRNADQVVCLRCGKLIENNKAHNRKYCPRCSGYTPAYLVQYKECAVCGDYFEIILPNNRQVRCDYCQAEEKRRLTRERVRKFRANKRNATEQKIDH